MSLSVWAKSCAWVMPWDWSSEANAASVGANSVWVAVALLSVEVRTAVCMDAGSGQQ